MPELVGSSIGRYQIINHLGQETCGEVFKAYDPKLDRTVAIQVLDQHLAEKSKIQKAFIQNALTVLNWRHPGIVKILDFGQEDSGGLTVTFLVREFIPGNNLRQLLQTLASSGQWIGLSEAVEFTIQLCQALEYAHQRGIPHGDLRPENILLRATPSGGLPYQPVLINLGLALPDLPVTQTKPQIYQAPEISRGGKITPVADVFSVGVLLYKMATGDLPPESDSTLEAMLPDPHLLRPDLPETLKRVIMATAHPNPKARISTIGALSSALAETLLEAPLINSSPPRFQEVVSLWSLFQNSTTELSTSAASTDGASPSRASTDIETSPQNTGRRKTRQGDQVHVLMPDQNLRSIPIHVESLTIGRGVDNDLTIEHPSVSRRHARLDLDGANYQITDLDSTNGTYIESERIEPGKSYTWLPGENLRLGEVWLRLEQADQSLTTAAMSTQISGHPEAVEGGSPKTEPSPHQIQTTEELFIHPDGYSLDAAKVQRSPGAGWIGAYIENSNPAVSPGARTEVSLVLFNRGPAIDIFRIAPSGVPAEWLSKPPQPISIPAGDQRQVTLIFTPPRVPQSRAGRHPVNVKITSQNDSNHYLELRLSLTIAAFSHFTCELRPAQVSPAGLGEVLVHNRGNLPETYSLVWDSQGRDLVFEPPLSKINIASGQTAVVEYRASLSPTRWFGKEMAHPFTVYVSSQAGQGQSLRSEYISRGLIPAWAPVVIASLCIVMTCVMFLLVNQLTGPTRRAEATAQAEKTIVAAITHQVGLAATQTAAGLASANVATSQAATATASWLSADNDLDGLTNNQENQVGTNPSLADTDEDVLKDGDEVTIWKTSPLAADTDGDGLKDGVEVEMGIDPLKKDTDGDGIEDAIDPDPGKPPTKTPILIPTYTPTQRTTPTRTNTPTLTHTPPVTNTDLSISINNSQSSSIPGTNLAYTILVTNKGPGSVIGARVTDNFPAIITAVSWTCSTSLASRCQTSNGIGNINALVDLSVGGTATLVANVSLSPTATSLLVNSANVSVPAGMTELNTVDNLAIDTDTLTPRVNLSLSKTDNRTSINPGQSNTYSIAVTNNGPSAVNGVGVSDIFPDKLSNITWTCTATSGSACAASSVQSGNINTNVNLYPGGTATINASGMVKDDATGVLSNSVNITSPIDPLNNNKSATDTTSIVTQADLEIEVIAPFSTTVNTPITYTINITNNGPSLAPSVVLNYQIPEGASFLSSDPGIMVCTPGSSSVLCNLADLPGGGTVQVKIVINSPLTTGPIASVAIVDCEETDPNPANNTVTIVVQVE